MPRYAWVHEERKASACRLEYGAEGSILSRLRNRIGCQHLPQVIIFRRAANPLRPVENIIGRYDLGSLCRVFFRLLMACDPHNYGVNQIDGSTVKEFPSEFVASWKMMLSARLRAFRPKSSAG